MSDDCQTAAAHSSPSVKPRRASHCLPNSMRYTAPDRPHTKHPETRDVGIVLKTGRTAFRLQLHFDKSMLSIERLSHLFVAAVMFNAKEAANYTLSIIAFLRGTKSIPLSEAARQSKNVHGSEALHCLC